ncbi:MAG: queuosine precursor transporter [Phycisphaerales bacterium JB063]
MPDTPPRPIPAGSPSAEVLHRRREWVFLLLAGLFLGTLAMLNILGISRFLVLASMGGDEGWQWGQWGEVSFALAVGVLPYPMTFLCTDLISEFYGRRRANAVVWVGLVLNLWVMSILWLGGVLPGGGPIEDAFFSIRTAAFGAVTASMVAYLVAQFVDVQLFHLWKRLTRGRMLWLRNNGSTMVSQLVDTVAVILITHFYANALPERPEGQSLATHLLLFIATGYAFKFIVAALDTPVIYLAVYLLKGYLGIDPSAEHAAEADEAALYATSD